MREAGNFLIGVVVIIVGLVLVAMLPDFLQMWAIIAFLLVILTKGLK